MRGRKNMEYKTSIFRDMRAFEPGYVPKDFICWEGELREIALCLEPAFSGYQALNAKVYGEPATGKTTAVKIMLSELMKKTHRVTCVYTNSSIYDSKFSIFGRILQGLGLASSSRSFERIYEGIFKKIEKDKKSLVIALDDINFLDSQILNQVLQAIMKANEEFNISVGVIAISSSPSFGIRLRSQVSSAFSSREIFLRPYKREEMHEIIKQRCYYGFNSGAIRSEAMSRVTAEAYAKGDLRLGIRLLKESGVIADKKGSLLEVSHVEKALSLPMSSSKIRSLNRLEIEMLKYICDREEATSGELYKRFDRGVSTIWRKVKKLEKMKLIHVEMVKGRGRTRRITCRELYRSFMKEFDS